MSNTKSYEEFLASKRVIDQPTGFNPGELHERLFDFQRDIVRWALRRGRAAVWADCGLGKTFQQLEWARRVALHTKKPVLILAPFGVVEQTHKEGISFGIPCNAVESQDDIRKTICPDGHPYKGVFITNYEKLHKFDPSIFAGVALDESSILKSLDGKTRNQLVEGFRSTPFKSAWTATPAPNDFMELGNHAEFLGVMTMAEMLSMFFVHDGGDTSKWRLKGHAEQDFWRWLASWAVNIRKPSDLGYDDGDFILPPMEYIEHIVSTDISKTGMLIPMEAGSLTERRDARRESIEERCERAAKIVGSTSESTIIWCGLNSEQDHISELLGDGCVSIQGSTPDHKRIELCNRWTSGEVQTLVTKGSIFGWGMNWQHCSNVIYCGLSDSFEEIYQTVRRSWRFGQKKKVRAHIVISDREGSVLANIKRKQSDAETMAEQMVKHMSTLNIENIKGTERTSSAYTEGVEEGKRFKIYLGDCVEKIKEIPDESVGFSVYSPPFASLYTYSASERDMGNCKDDGEFFAHYKFLISEMFRVTKPGRLSSVHCWNLPTSKARDGYIGIRDFRGEIIRAHINSDAADFHAVIDRLRVRQKTAFEARDMTRYEDLQHTIFKLEKELVEYSTKQGGFIFHSEVCIWKDPVTAMQRTKALGLLHKQMVKDSCMSRQGIPDYLVTFRKPGENPDPVSGELDRWIGDDSFHSDGRLSIDLWQRYASPVWMDINPSRTLQKESAREEADERHICPLQLDVIERAMELWSNPDDVVLSPFTGIGSEGYVALKNQRRFVGIELKPSYFRQAVANCRIAEETQNHQHEMFQ